jgi:cbb3-type cytochrome oxidase maturation protein
VDVLILLVFVSLILAGSAVGFFAWNLRSRNHEHADRLALMPLEDHERAPHERDEDR